MIIQGINQYQSLEARFKASKEKPKISPAVPATPQDTFDSTRKKADIRRDLVDNVKKKIKLGYYNSETVLDDLSNSFAKALNAANAAR